MGHGTLRHTHKTEYVYIFQVLSLSVVVAGSLVVFELRYSFGTRPTCDSRLSPGNSVDENVSSFRLLLSPAIEGD